MDERERERRRQIDLTLARMDRRGSPNVLPVTVISSGSISVDSALGVGGFPRGRVIEVFGPESCGKTTIALHVIAEAQKTGGAAAFIDAEHALDLAYAGRLGVDVGKLLVAQPDYGEQALEISAALVASSAVDVVVVDSVAALVPRIELEAAMGDSFLGMQARLMSQALRKLTASVSRTNACLIFLNQIREQIGVTSGNPETTTGGRALKSYASVRMDVRRCAAIQEGGAVVGNRIHVRMVKNKFAAAFREAEVEILYGRGISREGELLDLGVMHNLVERSGSRYSLRGEHIGHGREDAREYLHEHPEASRRLDADLRNLSGLSSVSRNAVA